MKKIKGVYLKPREVGERRWLEILATFLLGRPNRGIAWDEDNGEDGGGNRTEEPEREKDAMFSPPNPIYFCFSVIINICESERNIPERGRKENEKEKYSQ